MKMKLGFSFVLSLILIMALFSPVLGHGSGHGSGDDPGNGGGNGDDGGGNGDGEPIVDDHEDRYPTYDEVGEVSGSVRAGDMMYVTNPDGIPVMNLGGTPEMGRPLLDENGNPIISRSGAIFYYIGGRVIEVYSGMTIMPELYPGGSGPYLGEGGTSSDEGGTGSDEGGTSSDEGGTSSDEGGTSSDEGSTSSGEDGTSSDEGGSVDENVGSTSQGSYPYSPPPGALVRTSMVTFNAPAPPRVVVPPGRENVTERIVYINRPVRYVSPLIDTRFSMLQPVTSPVDDRMLTNRYGDLIMGWRVLGTDGTPVTTRTGIPFWVVTPEVRAAM